MIGPRKPADATMCPQVIAEDARRSVARLARVTGQGDTLSDPAQVYYLMGILRQLTQSLQENLNHLGQWWYQHERAHQLAVTEGPFTDDPSAAVTTAIASLTEASAACTNLTLALERAQICTSDLAHAPHAR